ncbi:sigma-70 family RNA polymerase sigma factor [Thermomonospora umbrina]|uniref:RNA polymerase sigma-70 factor (ECF subfamily) n=1 Tax=Thermomonospora umbrina TaxID=111806 RepID=A0A3D9STM7_9ACTN|nr:sigma-70 family RNA polymerase sigma factor [Thermomonospora umbrina]REE96335.1 RNA polymerase sigma-70 factor (ECF subfamily) [Thermomonospora umbrina]
MAVQRINEVAGAVRSVTGRRETDFARERPRLLAVAFGILGSDADAQDVVQEAWTRYADTDVEAIRNVQAWLTTVVTRLCLDLLRRSRELPHRPEELPAGVAEDPQDVAVLAGELTTAFTVVLNALTPPQRVAFILHDVFGAPFEEIAHILDTTPGSAKKLASRARGRLRPDGGHDPDGDPREARRVVGAFLKAARQGDIDGLVRVLHPAVTRSADPQALPPGARGLIRGVNAVVTETRVLQANARRARLVTIDGRPGIAVMSDRRVRIALTFHVAEARIVHYDVVADPRRLALLRIEE